MWFTELRTISFFSCNYKLGWRNPTSNTYEKNYLGDCHPGWVYWRDYLIDVKSQSITCQCKRRYFSPKVGTYSTICFLNYYEYFYNIECIYIKPGGVCWSDQLRHISKQHRKKTYKIREILNNLFYSTYRMMRFENEKRDNVTHSIDSLRLPPAAQKQFDLVCWKGSVTSWPNRLSLLGENSSKKINLVSTQDEIHG